MMVRVLRRTRELLHAVERPLLVVTFLLGVYLAAGNILDAASVPAKSTWSPWKVWFVLLLLAAVWVPLYALYQTVEARLQARAKLDAQAVRDLALLSQQIVGAIADACVDVAVNDLAACVWRCRSDGGFDELARFYLPHHRPPTGVIWHKGKGVAGCAWERDEDLGVDLRPLIARHDEIGAAAFDALKASERFGLSASELNSTRTYTGICAIRLFSTDSTARLLGMLVLDYVGAHGFGCIAEQVKDRTVRIYTGACAEVLTEARAKL